MNYYIQGNAANADKIKAAFEKLGVASNANRYNYKNDYVLYFSAGGMIHMIDTNSSWANIVKTHPNYKELELPVETKFKVGDWVVRKDGETFSSGNYAEQITLIEVGGKGKCICLTSTTWVDDDDIRLWTIADAKDGDVLAVDWHQDDDDDSWEKIVIFKKYHAKGVKGLFNSPCVEGYGNTFKNGKLAYDEEVPYYSKTWTDKLQPATKEQRDLMFTRIREAGYEWDADKKELNKIQPHYDISNFKPYQKVLIRFGNNDTWRADFFSHIKEDRGRYFVGIGYANKQCIPFEGNEHLLGTTDMCDEMYINW